MSTEFQISYTLDVLFYIECMLDEKKRSLYEEDINRFMPMLGTISDKYLERLKKIHQSTPEFICYIVAMLIVNDHLHDWKTTDLLDRHNRLVTIFKKAPQFKKASSDLKKFINGNYSKTMSLIKTIATDLERLEFKKFWLEEKLPLLKERTAEHQRLLSEFKIIRHINGWVGNQKLPSRGQWYMLAYSGDQYKVLLNEFHLTSPAILADQFYERIISYALKNASYIKPCKALKPDATLKAEYKGHKNYKSFKGISGYADTCVKIALKVYLMEGCGKHDLDLPDDYPFALEILTYLRENDKIKSAVGGYITEMMKHFSK